MPKTTEERFAVLETKLDAVQDDITEIKKALQKHLDWEETKYKEFTDACDKKYASKVTEKVVYGLVGAILLAVIAQLMGLITV